jgi:hypothetical protein
VQIAFRWQLPHIWTASSSWATASAKIAERIGALGDASFALLSRRSVLDIVLRVTLASLRISYTDHVSRKILLSTVLPQRNPAEYLSVNLCEK